MAAYSGDEVLSSVPFRVFTDLHSKFCPSYDSLKNATRALLDKSAVPESHVKRITDTMRYVSAFNPKITLKQFTDAIRIAGGPDMAAYLGIKKDNIVCMSNIPLEQWETWNEEFNPSACALQQVAMCIKNNFAHGNVKTLPELAKHIADTFSRPVSMNDFVDYLEQTNESECIQLSSAIKLFMKNYASDKQPESSDECCVCMNNPKEKSYVFAPCGHRPCCKKCSDAIVANGSRCPICREVSKYIRIFD